MLQLTPQMKVLVAVEPVDGRKGIDSLAQLCRARVSEDPFSGAVFIFRTRSKTSIMALVYDGNGFWLARSAFPKESFDGGPRARRRASMCRRTRPSPSLLEVILGLKAYPYGEPSSIAHFPRRLVITKPGKWVRSRHEDQRSQANQEPVHRHGGQGSPDHSRPANRQGYPRAARAASGSKARGGSYEEVGQIAGGICFKQPEVQRVTLEARVRLGFPTDGLGCLENSRAATLQGWPSPRSRDSEVRSSIQRHSHR